MTVWILQLFECCINDPDMDNDYILGIYSSLENAKKIKEEYIIENKLKLDEREDGIETYTYKDMIIWFDISEMEVDK